MSVVIVGAGQAGFQAALSLRDEGFDGSVVLLDAEGRVPYGRPPLSKAFLSGKTTEDDVSLRPREFYERRAIDLRIGDPVLRIDRSARCVELASGLRLPWSFLILATGARVRELPLQGQRPPGVHYLRTLDDAMGLRQSTGNILVIGSGFVGLEAASAFRQQGRDVQIITAEERVMGRAVSPVVSKWFAALHERNGVRIQLGIPVAAVDGATYKDRLVLVGIGVVPNVEIASAAGLATSNGIVVDEHLRTADPAIYAIGDCANLSGIRIESVQNAVDQAKCAASNIAGRPRPYNRVPWFWTEQFGARLQIAGLWNGCDRFVTRGSPEAARFSIFCFAGETLRAVESVNLPADHMIARKLLESQAPLAPAEAADEAFDLKAALLRP